MRFSIRTRPLLLLVLPAVAAVTAVLALQSPAPAYASSGQVAILGDDAHVLTNPAGTLATLKALGVSVVRLTLHWNDIAPDSSSPTEPKGFSTIANVPQAYPATGWAPYDAVVNDARADGIAVDIVISGYAPLWARTAGAPNSGPYLGSWYPSAADYGQFVEAVGLRYPTVHFWEIWNEENWGPSLSPQQVGGTSVSPSLYRGMLTAAWSSLGASGHGRDTIVAGSLSPRGEPNPGAQLTTRPLDFLRALYCVSPSYKPLMGAAASAAGCPGGTATAFRAANPALFNSSGFGIHPYPYNLPPTKADSTDPNFVEFNEIPKMATTLNLLTSAYGSHRHLGIYNTEYGYETDPPNNSTFFGHQHFVSPSTAAYYINWAEYLSWRDPQIASTDQYLLYDPNPSTATQFGQGGFATGLLFFSGKQKPSYGAFRMPLYLPVTSAGRGRSLEVWGCVRPAHTLPGLQRAQIQFQLGSRGAWRTVQTVSIHNVRGYFDVQVKFPASGSVRIAWSFPHGSTIISRTVNVTVH
jgi:hypothetical protein